MVALPISLKCLEMAGAMGGSCYGVAHAEDFVADWPHAGLVVWCCMVWFVHPHLHHAPSQYLSLSRRARFLENLAAAQKEKMSAMAKGRIDILSDVAPLEHPVTWDGDGSNPDAGTEPPRMSTCRAGLGVCPYQDPRVGIRSPSGHSPSHGTVCHGGTGATEQLRLEGTFKDHPVPTPAVSRVSPTRSGCPGPHATWA